MLSQSWLPPFVCVVLLAIPRCVLAEQVHPVRIPPTNPITGLRSLTRKSGYIFAGTVTAVQGDAARAAKDVATVRVAFHVDRGIRGVRTGQTLTIREWAGVWQYGERYRVGERVVLFLYGPSKLGLTSTVGGPQGRFSIGTDGGVGLDPVRFPVRPANPPRSPISQERLRVSINDFVKAIRLAEKE